MAMAHYKSDKTMNQIKRLSDKGLIVLEKLYIDLSIEEIYKNNNLAKGLEDLEIIELINRELINRNEKR